MTVGSWLEFVLGVLCCTALCKLAVKSLAPPLPSDDGGLKRLAKPADAGVWLPFKDEKPGMPENRDFISICGTGAGEGKTEFCAAAPATFGKSFFVGVFSAGERVFFDLSICGPPRGLPAAVCRFPTGTKGTTGLIEFPRSKRTFMGFVEFNGPLRKRTSTFWGSMLPDSLVNIMHSPIGVSLIVGAGPIDCIVIALSLTPGKGPLTNAPFGLVEAR